MEVLDVLHVDGGAAHILDAGAGGVEDVLDVLQRLRGLLARTLAGCCDDEGTKETIKKTFEDYGYLCDTHTAVGINVYEKYAEKTGDKTPTVIDSTANPFKFSRSVLNAVEPGASEGLDEFSMVGELARVTKTSCPPQLADLRDKPVRFRDVCDRDSMEKAVFRLLGI